MVGAYFIHLPRTPQEKKVSYCCSMRRKVAEGGKEAVDAALVRGENSEHRGPTNVVGLACGFVKDNSLQKG